MTIYY